MDDGKAMNFGGQRWMFKVRIEQALVRFTVSSHPNSGHSFCNAIIMNLHISR